MPHHVIFGDENKKIIFRKIFNEKSFLEKLRALS